MSLEWKPIPGFEGYEASSVGDIRSVDRASRGKRYKGTILAQQPVGPYLKVMVRRDGRASFQWSHALVCAAFHGERPDGLECCHGDRNGHNNHKENLRWDTPHGNANDRVLHGTLLHGEHHPSAILSEQAVSDIRARLLESDTHKAIAADYGVSRQTISAINQGRSWNKPLAGNKTIFHWRAA